LAEGQSKEFYWRLSHGEIKNGRVAMLAVTDYIVKGLFGLKVNTKIPMPIDDICSTHF